MTTRMAAHAIEAGEGDVFLSVGVECVSRYGSGDPDGLKAPQIPLEVRIVAVADRYEALRIARPDRAAMSADAAVQILQQSVQRGELDAAVGPALAAGVRGHDRGEAAGS